MSQTENDRFINKYSCIICLFYEYIKGIKGFCLCQCVKTWN